MSWVDKIDIESQERRGLCNSPFAGGDNVLYRERVHECRIDFVDPAHAPGTGTPEVGGATAREALALIRGLTDVAFAGFDLVEVSPAYDLSGITALLAANLVFEFISLIALRALRERNAI